MAGSKLGSIAVAALLVAQSFSCLAADAGPASVDAAWVRAMKANDLEAVLKTYAADAVVWLPDVPEARGDKAIRAAYEGMLSANTVKDVVLSETAYRTAGRTGVGWGRFVLTLAPKAGGAPASLSGRFTELLERRGDRWVYTVDHASAEPAPGRTAAPK